MKTVVLSATPVITAGAYSAGDAVGGKLTFTGAAIDGFNGGRVVGVTITDKAGQNAAIKLVLFTADFTATTDGDAFTLTDANLLTIAGIVPVAAADYTAFANNSAAYKAVDGPYFNLGATNTTLYGQLVTSGTPTYASTSDLKVMLHIEQDFS